MWIFCCGMHRSGSTVEYQITAEIVKSKGLGESIGYIKIPSLEVLQSLGVSQSDRRLFVVKCHHYSAEAAELIQKGEAKAIYIYRDIRDVVVSKMNKKQINFENIIERGAIERHIATYYKWTNVEGVLVSRYEDMMDSLKAEAMKIAAFLGIDLLEDLAEEIASKYSLERQIKRIQSEGQQQGERVYSRPEDSVIWQMHRNHINSGAARQWQYSLSPEQVAVIEKKASTWLVERGYPLSTDNLRENQVNEGKVLLNKKNCPESSAPRKKCYLSICAIVKNEAPYLVEWIEFHKIVGVERFYLYENSSTDNTKEILLPYVKSGDVVLHDWPLRPGQRPAYQHCLDRYSQESEWIAFIDADEFLFSPEATDLKIILKDYVDYPGVVVNWLIFGSSGHDRKPEGETIKNFTRRAKNKHELNLQVKSIVRSELTVRPQSVHKFLYRDGRLAVTENYEPYPISSRRTKTWSGKRIRINHYFTRSKEECFAKMIGGTAQGQERRTWDFFVERDLNEVRDLAIQKFLPQLELALSSLKGRDRSDPGLPDAASENGVTTSGQRELLKLVRSQNQSARIQLKEDSPQLALNKKPAFLIIGAMRCGTTSLYHYLCEHPQIIPAAKKEVHFFSKNFDRGVDWYLDHLPSLPMGGDCMTGEASVSYIFHPHAPQRLRERFPETKLVVLLRNPVDRLVSQYHAFFRRGIETLSLEDALAREAERTRSARDKVMAGDDSEVYTYMRYSYLSRSIYIEQLRRWMNVFPKEQFLILQSEKFFANPAIAIEQVLTFLGLPEHQLQEYRPYRQFSYPAIADSMRQSLSSYLLPYNRELERELGMKFNWDTIATRDSDLETCSSERDGVKPEKSRSRLEEIQWQLERSRSRLQQIEQNLEKSRTHSDRE